MHGDVKKRVPSDLINFIITGGNNDPEEEAVLWRCVDLTTLGPNSSPLPSLEKRNQENHCAHWRTQL